MADNSKWKGKNLSYMTPQMLHAMRMSQTQSQNNYKKSYNQDVKGKGSTAVDTVESQRVKKLTTEQSLLNYHKKFEESKSKGYTAVTETPELNRIKQQQTTRDVMYKKEFMEQKGHNIPVAETPESIRVKNQQKFLSDIKYQEDRSKLRGKATQVTDDPQMRRAMQAAKIASDVEYKKNKEKAEEMERRRQEMIAEQQTSKAYKRVAAPGSVLDYDPVQRMQQMSIQNKPREEPAPTHVSPPQSPIQQEPPKSPPADPEPQQEQQQPEPQEFVRKSDGHIYKAMYDYSAQDDDEVTFMDGDTIINAQKIDDGWMFGTVERTGQTGMLPSNYVVVMQ